MTSDPTTPAGAQPVDDKTVDEVVPVAKNSRDSRPSGRRLSYASRHHLALTVSILIVSAFLTAQSPFFLTTRNLLNVLQQMSFVGIIAFGMTLAIIAGELDISVGSMMGFSSALLGQLYVVHEWPMTQAIGVVFAVALGFGFLVGLMRTLFDVPSFILTLGTFSILSGLAYTMSDAIPVGLSGSWLVRFGTAKPFLDLPASGIVMLVILAAIGFTARHTAFGRSVYAVGGNSSAAHLSGISLARVRIGVLMLTAGLAALSGLLVSAATGSAQPAIGGGIEFKVFGAVIIGGTLLSGGRGSVIGTFLGVLLVALLNNGMVLMGVSSFAQDIAGGVVLVVAVMITSPRFDMGTVRRMLRRNDEPGVARETGPE